MREKGRRRETTSTRGTLSLYTPSQVTRETTPDYREWRSTNPSTPSTKSLQEGQSFQDDGVSHQANGPTLEKGLFEP